MFVDITEQRKKISDYIINLMPEKEFSLLLKRENDSVFYCASVFFKNASSLDIGASGFDLIQALTTLYEKLHKPEWLDKIRNLQEEMEQK